MKKILLLAAFCVAVFSNAQTIIYNADFSNNGDGFPDHTSSAPPVAGPTSVGPFGLSPNSWELSYSTTPSTDGSANSFKVVSGELQSDDWGGQGIFLSQNIDVSSISSTNIMATGVNSGANDDNFTYFYILDGGSRVETPIGVSNNGDPINYSVVGLDVSSANSLIVGFEFSENGAGDGYDISVFQVTGTSSSGNPAPLITNTSISPAAPASTDIVTVSADITDDTGLNSVVLEYGFSTGVYDQTPIVMTNTTGDMYEGDIPAQVDGTEVFYRIIATDNDPMPATSTSAEQSYLVLDPQPQGLQVDQIDTKYLIDFDNTVINVNNGSYAGSGFAIVPNSGQLDADAFAIDGLQDGTTNFGDEQSGNDFGKGISNGGVSSGGIYAFEVATNDYALGIQPTGSDFTPGTIHLIFTNNTGVAITDLSIGYDFYINNNESRANDLVFSHGPDASNLSVITDSRLSSELGSDSSPVWERNLVAIDLTSLSIPAGSTYVIAWTSEDQGSGSSDEIAIDNIQIVANPVTNSTEISGDFESITLLGNASATAETNLHGNLNLSSGQLSTNDNLTLKSSAGKSAAVAPVLSGSIIGDVTVEQYYSDKRAYRLVGSTVETSTGSIFDNWQQSGLNPGDMGYESGFGTHITGGTLANGFDQSGSNAVSMFTYNNASQVWQGVTNTNANSLSPGNAYRLFIRGDRSVSLTTANAPSTSTVLRTKGTLSNSFVDINNLSTTDGAFNFIANPYQAQVNFATLMADTDTEDINESVYYAWDPTIGDNGAYVTYDFGLSMNNVGGSEVDQFLQPGQAVFVVTSEDGDNAGLTPGMRFKQSFKVSSTDTNNVYRSSNNGEMIAISLYKDTELNTGLARDGVIMGFDANQVIDAGAVKFQNPDENLAISKNNQSLSILKSNTPSDGEIINLELNGLTGNDYTVKVNNDFSSLQAIWVDHYLLTETVLNQGLNSFSVVFDPSQPSSYAADRFSIKFSDSTLSVDDSAFAKAVTLYPNPLGNSILTIENLDSDQDVNIKVLNSLGQVVMAYKESPTNGVIEIKNLQTLESGIYFLSIDQATRTVVKRFIKN